MWDRDPKLRPFSTLPSFGRNYGYAGPFDRKAAESKATYIVVDIFARVTRGDTTEEAIEWGEQALKQVYEM